MSSSLYRDPLTGTIRQGKKVIGGVCLPEQDPLDFIDQFNHCYGPMGLRIDLPLSLTLVDSPKQMIPVGAGHYNPFRKRDKQGG